MENGNQIKDIFIQSKMHFLKDDINALRIPKAIYNLNEEFYKTKKNKTRITGLIILILVVVFSALALVVTYFIQENTKNVSVKIDAFTDLGLKDILDRAKKLEADYSRAQQEYNDIGKERDDKIVQLKKEADQKILLVENRKMSVSDQKSAIDRINRVLRTEMTQTEVQYKKEADNKQLEIDAIKKQMDQEDADKVKLAKENEVILDNQKKLFNLQMNDKIKYYDDKIKKLVVNQQKEIKKNNAYQNSLINILKDNQTQEIKELILKYNPIYDSEVLKTYFNEIEGMEINDVYPVNYYYGADALSGDDGYAFDNFSSILVKIRQYYMVLNKLKETEYINDVPKILNYLKYLGNTIIGEYENLWQNLVLIVEKKNDIIFKLNDIITKKNSEIADFKDSTMRFNAALDSILDRKSGEVGFVVSAKDLNNIVIYFSEDAKVAAGDSFRIFDLNYKLVPGIRQIGSVMINSVVDEITALASETERMAKSIPIKAFDKVLTIKKL